MFKLPTFACIPLTSSPFGPIKPVSSIVFYTDADPIDSIPTAFVTEFSTLAALHPEWRKRYVSTEIIMASGPVKWFNPTTGFGFIQPDQGGTDVFVHISAVERAGLRSLNEGQKVSYELVTDKGKTSAGNLQVAA